MHELDEVDRLRRTLIPKLDNLVTPFGLYAENTASPDGYVLTLTMGVEEAEGLLHDSGLLRNGMAGYKTLEPYGVREAGSWAWRYDVGDEGSYRWFGDRQVHLTLFEYDGETHVFAHDELNPWRHPVKHYRGDDFDRSVGVHWTHHFFASRNTSYKIYADLDRAFE